MLRGLLVVQALLLLDGCTGGECGVGTVRYGDTCVAVDPFDKTPPKVTVDPPLYTREVGTVRLTADEPATIYYTTDGTSPTLDSASEPDVVVIPNVPDNAQLRYFAVDLAGNKSPEELRVWIIDRQGPGAPLDFHLALAGSSRSLSWVAPPDPRIGGVLVARVEGPLAAPPEGGKAYAAGDGLSPGVTVVSVTDPQGAGAFSETLAAPPGLVRYVAWAFDDLHNYGPPAGDYALVPIPPQTAAVTVTAGTNTLTVTTPPSVLHLSGDAQLAGSTLTVHLDLRNDSTRVLYAPKLVLTSNLPGAVAWSNSDGTYSTKPYRAYGAALLPGTSTKQTWTFTGVTGATTLNMNLDLVDGFVMTVTQFSSDSAGSMFDFATGTAISQLATVPTGNGGRGTMAKGGITPDGRLIAGSRNSGSVTSFDLVTGNRLVTTQLRHQKAQVPQIILDRSGSAVYAIVADGHPDNINNNSATAGSDTELVMLDAGSLTVGARVDLGESRNRDISISPDGRLMLIATGLTAKGVIVIDLTTLTIKTRLMPGFRPQNALFGADGSIIIVGEQIAIYTQEGTRTAMWETPGTSGKVVRAILGAPDILFIGRRNELDKIDLRDGTGSVVVLPGTSPPQLAGRYLDMFDGKIYALTASAVTRLDATAQTIELTFAALPGNLGGHWIGRSPF